MNKNQEEQIADQIIEIIDWYRELPEDYTEVNDLMYARQRLSALVFNFSNLVVSNSVQAWKNAQSITENKKFQIRVQHQNKGVAQARNISKANTYMEFELEKKYEGIYLSAKHLEKSMYEVLDSMNQHISHLKEELKYSRYKNQTK
jgi:hypothetical protein